MDTDKKVDQAAELRDLFGNQMDGKTTNHQKVRDNEIDVLHLPPRREVHTGTGKINLKINKPFIRFFFVILLLTIMIIGAYYYIGDELFLF